MRIERPRSPQMVSIIIRGQPVLRPKVGYAQRQALALLARLGVNDPPPKGAITATGVLREHVFRDMLPHRWVTVRPLNDGAVQYAITAIGRKVLKDGVVQFPRGKKGKDAKGTGNGLLARQRAAAAAKAPQKRAANTKAGRRATG